MKNKETLQAVMDRRLSFLDGLPSCRPALMQRIAQEEAPVMKRKISVGLVFALVLVSLSVIALATGLILSPRVSAARTADPALAEKYGLYVTAGSDYHGEIKLVELGDNGLDDIADGPAGLRHFLEDVEIIGGGK